MQTTKGIESIQIKFVLTEKDMLWWKQGRLWSHADKDWNPSTSFTNCVLLARLSEHQFPWLSNTDSNNLAGWLKAQYA